MGREHKPAVYVRRMVYTHEFEKGSSPFLKFVLKNLGGPSEIKKKGRGKAHLCPSLLIPL
jgi:hypothetical protein